MIKDIPKEKNQALRLLAQDAEIWQMLQSLVEKLKGKPVYKTLKKISAGKCKSKVEEAVGIASLTVHCLIEMKGKSKQAKEYRKLVANLYEKLGVLIYEI